jgi:cobalamin synthase
MLLKKEVNSHLQFITKLPRPQSEFCISSNCLFPFHAGTIGLTDGLKQAVFALNNYIPLVMFVIILLLFRYKSEELLPDILKKNEAIP